MKKIYMLKSLIIASFFITLVLFSGCNSAKEASAQTNSKSSPETHVNQISIPVSDISEIVKLYKYETDTKTISFFAVKASDGK